MPKQPYAYYGGGLVDDVVPAIRDAALLKRNHPLTFTAAVQAKYASFSDDVKAKLFAAEVGTPNGIGSLVRKDRLDSYLIEVLDVADINTFIDEWYVAGFRKMGYCDVIDLVEANDPQPNKLPLGLSHVVYGYRTFQTTQDFPVGVPYGPIIVDGNNITTGPPARNDVDFYDRISFGPGPYGFDGEISDGLEFFGGDYALLSGNNALSPPSDLSLNFADNSVFPGAPGLEKQADLDAATTGIGPYKIVRGIELLLIDFDVSIQGAAAITGVDPNGNPYFTLRTLVAYGLREL